MATIRQTGGRGRNNYECVSTLLGKMILMIMLSDDMSSLSHDEFMEVICGVCARKGAYSRKRDGKRSDKQKLGYLKPISLSILLIHIHHYPNYVIGSCPSQRWCGPRVCWRWRTLRRMGRRPSGCCRTSTTASSSCRGGPGPPTAARAAGAGWAG